jgi:DNA-binding FrmR family transcriptional regulator
VELGKLAYKLRWKEIMNANNNDNVKSNSEDNLLDIIHSSPFDKPNKKAPIECVSGQLDITLKALKHEMHELIQKHKKRTVKQNLNTEQRNTLSELVKLKDDKIIRFSVSDKGGEFVVTSSDLDKRLTELHLANPSLYEHLKKDQTKKAEEEINEVWRYIYLKNKIDQKSAERLVSTHSVCPVIYLLTKTHKFKSISLRELDAEDIKVRPIISGCESPADKISWLIHKICVPLLKYVKAHLTNTGDLLAKLGSLKQDDLKNKILFSLDVVSLYPSVDNMAAVDTLRDYLYQHRRHLQLYGIPIPDIVLLTKIVLSNSCFSWSGTHFKQLRGLAMGNRLAPILAILYMDRIENQAIYADTSLSTKPYHRYIDDCITTAQDNNEARSIQEILNAQDPSIKFEIELPDEEGYQPFLNTKLRVKPDGTLDTAWYTKQANKGVMIHALSHHPKSMKIGAIQNTLKTILLSEIAPSEMAMQQKPSQLAT